MSKVSQCQLKTKHSETANLDLLFKPYQTEQPCIIIRKITRSKLSNIPSEKNLKKQPQEHKKKTLFLRRSKNSFNDYSRALNKSSKGSITNFSTYNDEKVPKDNAADISSILIQRIKSLYESVDSLEVYFDIFNEVILNEKHFGKVLTLLKKKFETVAKNLVAENEDLKINLKNVQNLKKCLEADNDKKIIENQELNKDLEDLHKRYVEITDKFFKITNVDFSPEEMTESNMKQLKQQSVIYKDLMNKMDSDIKFYKRKLKKFVKVFNVLEEKGIDIEQIYLSEVAKEKVLPNYTGKSEPGSCTEDEYLTSHRNEGKKKPLVVPSLDVMNISLESSDDSDSISSQTE